MKKIIMVDGNNLIFRSYYATAYNGNLMKNSKGFPTNAIFGFVNMINKIIIEEKPVYMLVAFDKGRTFRHDFYEQYKEGRIETPDDLKKQFPIAKEVLNEMGIKYYEIDDYEADDIIGTFATFCDKDTDYIGTIVSSDKDLLQLISSDVDIKLLKQKDYIRYDEEKFTQEYGISPINVIDLKALEGDPSDNIPGVKGIGEKTALKLLQGYQTLDGIYENIDKIPGKLKEKLINDKENAYLSYRLAKIKKDVPLDINIDDILIKEKNKENLIKLYEELEFYSLLKKERKNLESAYEPKQLDFFNNIDEQDSVDKTNHDNFKIITNIDEVKINNKCAIYLETLGTNYHQAKIIGMSIYNNEGAFFVPEPLIKEVLFKINNIEKYTYDLKKMYVALKWQKISFENVIFDTMIAGYLLDYNIKDDIAYVANNFDYKVLFNDEVYGKKVDINNEKVAYNAIVKAKFIYETFENFIVQLKDKGMFELYYDIDFPLTTVLGEMEYDGIKVDQEILKTMGDEINLKIELISNDIYNYAGEVFNIASPFQLGVILFEKLGLKHGKKSKRGYSTAIDVLNKLRGSHPIIEKIIEHRILTKLYTTYIEGLINNIMNDGKIHTIYNQTLTRTGRLSSVEPNLQNIPIRYEYGRLIRKAFLASENSVLLSADYSQIELRIMAHMSKVDALIEAFKNNMDIHTKTAMDIFKVPEGEITKNMRRVAKAVNFGIIYGISSFGLSENLDIMINEAKDFIENYLTTYPGIKNYMDITIKEAYQNGYVQTLFKRRRNIAELSNKNYMIRQQGERMALNTPIQGTSADILKLAMIKISEEFNRLNLQSKMILQVHDELVFDVVNNEFDQVKEVVRLTMENVRKLDVPLKVDLAYGSDWYQAK